MNSKEFTAQAKQIIESNYGLDQKVFATAMAKFKRHIRNKYGSLDYQLEVDENGDAGGICHFYRESRDGVKNTFNREVQRNRI